jgi:hypothetical protein
MRRSWISLALIASLFLPALLSPAIASAPPTPVPIVAVTPAPYSALPQAIAPSRTIDMQLIVNGHRIHWLKATPQLEAALPRNVYPVTVDDGPLQYVAFMSPNQGPGNFPGISTLTAGVTGNITINNTDPQNPIIDLQTGLTLSASGALTFTAAAGPIFASSATGVGSAGYTLNSQGAAPVRDFVFHSTNGGSTSLAEFQVGATTELKLDASGNLVLNGNDTAVNGVFSGTLNVTGTSTLGVVGAGATTVTSLTDSGLTASQCVGANGSSALASQTNCVQSLTAGSNIVSSGISGSTPTVAVTNAPTFTGNTAVQGTLSVGTSSVQANLQGLATNASLLIQSAQATATPAAGVEIEATAMPVPTSTTGIGAYVGGVVQIDVPNTAATQAPNGLYFKQNNNASTNGPVKIAFDGPSGQDVGAWQCVGTCTGANNLWALYSNSTQIAKVTNGGTATFGLSGNLQVGGISTSTTNFVTNGTGSGAGQILTAGATKDTTVGLGGSIIQGATGTYMQGTNCSATAANAGAVTIAQPICNLTSGAAPSTATYTITLPWTATTAANIGCIAVGLSADAVVSCKQASTSTVTLVMASTPGASVLFAFVVIVGNGPI